MVSWFTNSIENPSHPTYLSPMKNNKFKLLYTLFTLIFVAIPLNSGLNDLRNRSLVTYGALRVINGSVSVIQESHVEISPAGLGASIAAGQILDPLNDLVERASDIVFTGVLIYGIFSLLDEPLMWILKGLLVISLLLIWLRKHQQQGSRRFWKNTLLVLLWVQIATWGSPWLEKIFIEKRLDNLQQLSQSVTSYDENKPELAFTAASLKNPAQSAATSSEIGENTDAGDSFLSTISSWYKEKVGNVQNAGSQLGEQQKKWSGLLELHGELIKSIILVVEGFLIVLVIEILLLPLVLWLLLRRVATPVRKTGSFAPPPQATGTRQPFI